jgi:hypothetical protein
MNRYDMDPFGIYLDRDTTGMRFPVIHRACGQVHDSGKGEVVGRYADCTRWRCPHCDGICDDRPIGWGGNVEKLYE